MTTYGPSEDIEKFEVMTLDEIRDWFYTATRSMSSAESRIFDLKCQLEIDQSHNPTNSHTHE